CHCTTILSIRTSPRTVAIECPPALANSVLDRHTMHRRQPKIARKQRAFAGKRAVLRFLPLQRDGRLKSNSQLIGKFTNDATTEQKNARDEYRALYDQNPFADWSKLELHDEDHEGAHDRSKDRTKTADQRHQHDFTRH